jgi:ribonucleoside-triphosphate reductase
MEVRKHDGSFEEFNPDKVKKGICEAYLAVKEECPEGLLDSLIKSLLIYEKIESFEIRRQVEEALMSVNKKVARAYIKKYEEIEEKHKRLKKNDDFVKNYINASNAATGSKYDSNANVSNKNIVTLGQEIHKGDNIQQNRYIMHNKIKALYSKKLANQYIYDLEHHIIYRHDESGTPGYPYCVAITMYPFLVDGLKSLGGQSKAPTDLKSYCGEFINLVYSVSSQFMGAVATPEFLMYMDYFIRKDYGDEYLTILNKQVEMNRKGRTLEQVIENCFQQVVHSMNMPAGNRGYQTVFWNCSYFDKPYFDGVFGEFRFPDGTAPKWETLSWLQKKFMKWFNEERTKYILTFPVETLAMLTDGNDDFIDKEYADFAAEMWSEGHSFFCYLSDSPDSLSSCCRLRNSLKDAEDNEHNHTTHQFSMGTASVATGSKCVMTIDLNRAIQDAVFKYYEDNGISYKKGEKVIDGINKSDIYPYIKEHLTQITERVHKYLTSFNAIVKDFYQANMLTVYSAGFIDMRKQYLTVGVNGLTDAAEFFGLDITPNDDYVEFVNVILETINVCNKKDRTRDCMFNTEFIPGENVSYKHYNWDKNDGYYVSPKHIMYSSYFYNPEDDNVSVLDKFVMHGKKFSSMCDGGMALHQNLQESLSKEQYRKLLKFAAKNGTSYFTFNVRNTCCEDCGYISKHTLEKCPHCGSTNISHLTRIIGYLKKIKDFSEPRQIEAGERVYN